MTSAAQDEFEAARSIATTLKGFEKAKQEQILRWVAEHLGLAQGHHSAAPQHPPQSSPLTPPVTGTTSGGTNTKDIKTFVDEKQPKSDNQFAAVAAYYYRFHAPEKARAETITPSVLQDAARMAGRNRFTKPAVTLHNAMHQGYLDRAGRGEFAINAVGENLVAMTLPGAAGSANDRKRSPRKAGTKKPRASSALRKGK